MTVPLPGVQCVLRLQLDPTTAGTVTVSRERAFADFAFANLVLTLLVWNFMG